MKTSSEEAQAVENRYNKLMPFMKYLYFLQAERRYRQDGSFDPVFSELETAGKLVEFILTTKQFSKPHDLYYHIKSYRKSKPATIKMANDTFMIADEMAKRCCYLFEKKGKLSELKFYHPFFIRGKKDLRWWIALLENKELSSPEAKTSFEKWKKSTEVGKSFAIRQNFYQYVMLALMSDYSLSPKCIISEKWYKIPKGTKPLSRQKD